MDTNIPGPSVGPSRGPPREPDQAQPSDMPDDMGRDHSTTAQTCPEPPSQDGNAKPDGSMIVDAAPSAEHTGPMPTSAPEPAPSSDEGDPDPSPGQSDMMGTAPTTTDEEHPALESSQPAETTSSVKVKTEAQDKPISSITESQSPHPSQSKGGKIEAHRDDPTIKREPVEDTARDYSDTDTVSEPSMDDDENDGDYVDISVDDESVDDSSSDSKDESHRHRKKRVKTEVKNEHDASDAVPDSPPPKDLKSKGKKERKRPQNARAWWKHFQLRWNAKRNIREQAKRTRYRNSGAPSKKRKPVENGESVPEGNRDATDEHFEAPSMVPFQASNRKEQWQGFKANMPKGGDVRRAAHQTKDLKQATRSFGFARVVSTNDKFRIKSMITSVWGYQLTLISWMIRQEVISGIDGGIVADAMGLGKTVVSLALMVEHQARRLEESEDSKATLVIVPNRQIANQWAEEAGKHLIHGQFTKGIMIYRRGGLDKSSGVVSNYRSKKIVITTYHEVIKSYPRPDEVAYLREQYKSDRQSFRRDMANKVGVLFRIKWHRVILDEAHHIKNANSHTTMACWALSSTYRWCLSGTPLANTPREFFPYLKFLGCNFTDKQSAFESKYTYGESANDNFEQLVKALVYRRTQKDEFLGCKIVDLPKSTSHVICVPPSQEEEILLESIEQYHCRLKPARQECDGDGPGAQFDDQPKGNHPADAAAENGAKEEKGEIGNTGLRAISHIFNLENMLRTKMTLEEIRNLRDKLHTEGGRASIRDQLQQNVSKGSGISEFQSGLDKLAEHESPLFGGKFNMKALLQLVHNDARVHRASCSLCENAPEKAVCNAQCGHVYCQDCVMKVMLKIGPAKYPESKCFAEACEENMTKVDSLDTLTAVMKEARQDRNFHEPGADAHNISIVKEPGKNGLFTACFRDQDLKVPPSSKLLMAMAVILQWKAEFPKDKVIVFTQFVATGKILGLMLQAVGIEFLYNYGTVPGSHRQAAIDDFTIDPDKKILISGLRAGSEGLNLTAANRVIIIDPWWNSTAEDQACGRVQRIGQKKECHFVRILTTTNVDQRIAEMQRDKSVKIDYALQDDGHTPAEVDDERLAELFTPVAGAEGATRDKPFSNKKKRKAPSKE